jgi:hypothetical protein
MFRVRDRLDVLDVRARISSHATTVLRIDGSPIGSR